MSETHTRLAVATDINHLVLLWREQRDIEMQLDPRLTHFQSDPLAWEVMLAGFINQPTPYTQVTVAEREGRVLGFTIAQYTDQTGVLEDMVLDAHFGSGGIGSVLLDAVQAWLRENGVRHLVIRRVPRMVAVQQAFWLAKHAVPIQETLYLAIRAED